MVPFEKNMAPELPRHGLKMVGIVAATLFAAFLVHSYTKERADELTRMKETFDQQIAEARERLEYRPEVLTGLLGLPLPDSCDENGTMSDNGDAHCASLDGYRVWRTGGYTRFGSVSFFETVQEALKVRPDYLYGQDRADYQVNASMDWEAARKALDSFREASLAKLTAVDSEDLHVLTADEIDYLRNRVK
jgi:hypothetical protein